MLERVPLGGDGFEAPAFAYALTRMNVTGNVSGGAWTITAVMDPRFCSLIAYATIEQEQTTPAAANVRYRISDQLNRTPPQVLMEALIVMGTSTGLPNSASSWSPVPLILPGGAPAPQIIASGGNLDGDEYFLSILVYGFDIRVRELTPVGPLLWSRGAT